MKEDNNTNGAQYWKSLDDLADTPAFKDWMKNEFPAGASELEGVNRRNFMKIMAASFGLAGLGMSGCRRPKQHILPYSKQPENLIPGVANFYCTSIPGLKANIPAIVESHQARPTKIEGNPSYAPFGGATSTHNQASILDLYDPDRSTKSSLKQSKIAPFQVRDELASIKNYFSDNEGEGFAVLAEPSSSPSRESLKNQFKQKYPKAQWVEYSPSLIGNARTAASIVYGTSLEGHFDFSKLDRVLSLDADFLSEGDNAIAHARGFTSKRKILNKDEASKMNRLYVVESSMTTTGAMADHRLRLSAVQMTAFLAKCASELVRQSGVSGDLLPLLDQLASDCKVESKWISESVIDLYQYKGHSAVIVGDHLPVEAQAVAFYINQILETPVALYETSAGGTEGIASLVASLNEGSVDRLLILGGNPAFDAPADLNWTSAQAKAKQSYHLSYWFNETSELAHYHIAESHYLESWSDGRTPEGYLVPVQPLIDPLFETFNVLDVLSSLVDSASRDAYSIVKSTYSTLGGSDFNRFLSEGVSKETRYSNIERAINSSALGELLKKSVQANKSEPLSASNLELRFVPSFHALDGRFANNGWMMECPDPISKLTWDNALLVSPRLAKDLEREYGVSIFAADSLMNKGGAFFKSAKGELQKNSSVFKDGKESALIVELQVNGKTLELPIHVLPGLANYTAVLPYGMGRSLVGRVGENVGFNAYPARTATSMGFATGVRIKPLKNRFYLANTQEHWSMEGRAIVREGTTDYYKKDSNFVSKMGVESHAPDNYGYHADKSLAEKSLNQYRGNSAYVHPKFNEPDSNVKIWKDKEDQFVAKQQWGMAIDMNSCTGCSACVVACQSENNIPIVGKDQVLRGREMHWLRLDRYFSAEQYNASEIPEDVQVSFMGMMCAHCENAPCESVCPVNATVHDKEGLNTMAYNRCVGTRYCANNCPYKVRRFNFFDWNKRQIGEFYKGPLGSVDEPELEKMRANPDVTVRMRGVMEKCTYCVQRIQSAKINQKRIAGASNDVHVPDGTIKTACQQVCPTDAITFGDISDGQSEVSKMKASDRNYSVLGYLNVRPRTTYLARLRNPNKSMPDYYKYPYAYKSYKERYGAIPSKSSTKSQASKSDHEHTHAPQETL
jgi:molybdopterin-containing oxidoreductase family iron-sulfur binding subunit